MFKLFQALRPGRGCSKYIACSDASQFHKFMADVVLTGSADQVAINALLTAYGAGDYLISPGTVNITSQIATTVAGQTIRGSGMTATTVFANASIVNGPMLAIAHNYCSLSDMTIDGNKANNGGKTAMLTFSVTGGFCRVNRVYGKNSPGNGANVTGDQTDVSQTEVSLATFVGIVVGSTGTGGAKVVGCTFNSNGVDGAYISVSYQTLIGCRASSNGQSGFRGTSSALGCVILGCEARSNGSSGISLDGSLHLAKGNVLIANAGYGVVITGGASNSVIGNVAYANANGLAALVGTYHTIKDNTVFESVAHGITLNATTECQVVANYCFRNGTATNDTYSNIILQTGTNNSNVQGNSCRRGATGNLSKYGIRIDAGATANLVTNNDLLTGGNTASLSDAGTSTVTTAGNRT